MIRVLIVEDDPMVADLAAVYLEGIEGFCLEGRASSGEAALELLRIIKTSFLNTDVIMITAAQNSDDILNALRMGVADYIVKPYTFERFRESLIQFREKRQLLISPEVSITQEMLDRRIFVKKSRPAQAETPKGIDPSTLQSIIDVLQNCPSPVSLKDVEPLTGISRISLKKYFDYLAASGRLGSEKDYGGHGRPVTRYWWIN